MREELKRIEKAAEAEIESAGTLDELQNRRIQFLGRERGALTAILRALKGLDPGERADVGKRANVLRQKIEAWLKARERELKKQTFESVLEKERIDVSRPGFKPTRGHLHPLTALIRDIEKIFAGMGFVVAEGPELESEWYNFDALNIPENHPARDMWDTFWVKGSIPNPKTGARERLALRPHTSPVQIRYMETRQPPIRIIAPGRAYRYEATDASHEIQFYQLEGLMVDRQVSVGHFKAVIEHFLSRIFGASMEVLLRPSYFPFVEPGFEVDMRPKARGAKKEPWLEIAGAGLVHPKVIQAAGLNPKEWQGFAFGFGIDRIAMLKYKIPDIRLMHAGDMRFLKQF